MAHPHPDTLAGQHEAFVSGDATAGDLCEGAHGQESNCTVASRQGVGDVAAQGGSVTHLWSTDQAASFMNGLGVLQDERIGHNPAQWRGRADIQAFLAYFDGRHFWDGSDIHQRIERGAPALL